MTECLHKFKKDQFLRWSCCVAIKSARKIFKILKIRLDFS